jgi:serine/threonine protein kinase
MSVADEQAVLSASIDSFFVRCGLDPRARLDCHAFADKFFPGKPKTPAHTQGYCSYTVSIDDYIVQFRPPKYKLDLNVAFAAKIVFGTYVPSTNYYGTVSPHGLLVYIMTRMPGISYKELTLQDPNLAAKVRKRLCEDFAIFLAKAFHRRAEICLPLGMIGSSIKRRLESLLNELPRRFRPIVKHVMSQYHLIEALPMVLAHGDIVPSNILLDPTNGQLFGLVDWAEAEMLPFGICLYGLEEILGYMTADNQFVYYSDAEESRAAFWERFQTEIPLLGDTKTFEAVLLARELGILLWHGFAFDDGAINRVVEEGRDCQEICYLDTLLGHRGPDSSL